MRHIHHPGPRPPLSLWKISAMLGSMMIICAYLGYKQHLRAKKPAPTLNIYEKRMAKL